MGHEEIGEGWVFRVSRGEVARAMVGFQGGS